MVKNGKWRYYYDVKDALGYDERDNAGEMVYRRELTKRALTSDVNQKTRDALEEQLHRYTKDASHALEKYYKTPLGKLDKIDDVIDVGRNKVANLIGKIEKRIRAKEEDITKYAKPRKHIH